MLVGRERGRGSDGVLDVWTTRVCFTLGMNKQSSTAVQSSRTPLLSFTCLSDQFQPKEITARGTWWLRRFPSIWVFFFRFLSPLICLSFSMILEIINRVAAWSQRYWNLERSPFFLGLQDNDFLVDVLMCERKYVYLLYLF